jgi:RimJ/RimL family protein N-acetyltransferase
MQEAISKILEFGFRILSFKTIVACSNAANENSIRLLEKNSFQRDRTLEDEYYSADVSQKEIIYLPKSPFIL